ncbi:MAG: ABC transporter permease, partial [Myxococcota bacterium]
MKIGFVWAMARRELRSSRRRLALYGACMAIGIAALVALHGFRAATLAAVDSESRGLLGADLRLTSRESFDRKDEALRASIAELTEKTGSRTSRVTSFASMALAERTGRTRMVQVLASDGAFPFYGVLRTEPPGLWKQIGEARSVLVDPAVLVQLDTAVGETLKLGEARFEIAGTVTRAPSAIGLRGSIAPRVYMPRGLVDATGLVRQGSLVEFIVYAATEDDEALGRWLVRTRRALEGQRVRVETVESYRAQLAGSLSSFTRFLGLVGLMALLLGGIGVASGVRVFAREKLDTAAVLRALGASQNEVLAIYLAQAAALGAFSALAGGALGLAIQALLPRLLGALLPLEVPFAFEPVVLGTGLALGVVLAVLFASWPLLELHGVAPLRALRRDFSGETRDSRARLGVALALGASLLAASLWQAPSWRTGAA